MSGLARIFILSPVLAIVLTAIILVGGVISYQTMTREAYPDLAIPQATVTVTWPGASPAQMEQEITDALERELRGLDGLRRFASSSQNSFSIVTVEFVPDANIDTSMRALRVAVDNARAQFPQGAEAPEVQQVAVSDTPILTFAIAGDADPLTRVEAVQALDRALERVAGVRRVEAQGMRDRAVHIRLDPAALRSLGLSPSHVRQRLQDSNQDLAWGLFEDETGSVPLYLEGRFRDLEQMRRMVVAQLGEGRLVRLEEVANVFIGLNERDRVSFSRFGNGDLNETVSLSVLKRPGGDTLATIAAVREAAARHIERPDWPPSLSLIEVSSEGEQIQQSFDEVTSNLGQGIIAVFLILLVVLSWRAAVIASLALPVAMLAALLALNGSGFTLNTLIILGAVIALGLIVDVFILVMEGMHENMNARGQSWSDAAFNTVKSFFLPALAGQATTILAMLPLLMIAGVDGKFIRQIPIAAIACLVTALIVAFLICIPLSRFLLKRQAEHKPSYVDRLSAWGNRALHTFLLALPLRNRWTAGGVVALTFGALIGAMILASALPTIVYPPEDRRNLGATITLRPDAPLAETEALGQQIATALEGLDYLESVNIHTGELSPYTLSTLSDYLADTRSPHLLGVSIRFTPKEARPALAYTYIPEIRARLASVVAAHPGAELRLTPDLGGAGNADPIQIELRGDNLQDLRDATLQIRGLLSETEGVGDIRDSLGAFRTEARFRVNPEALSFHGLSESELLDQLRIAMTADKIGTFDMPGTQPDLDIRLGMNFPSRNGIGGPREIHELEAMAIISADGMRVPFVNLVEPALIEVPSAIIRADGARAVTIGARPVGDANTLAIIETLEPEIASLAEGWPSGFEWRFRGEVESAGETFGSTGVALLLAIALVFAVLALLFQSLAQPLIILATAPVAMIGVFAGFWLLAIPISFPAMIGGIALIGIIVNNAILIVEMTNAHLREGSDLREAAARGAADRLRPIATTTLTTIAGLLPLALSSPAWYPLCMAVILGLSVGTLLTLLIVPALSFLLGARPAILKRPEDAPQAKTA